MYRAQKCISAVRALGVSCMSTSAQVVPSSCVLYEVSSTGVATLTMNSTKNRNALSTSMMQAIMDCLARVVAHDRARVLVFRATGPAFSAGHDLKELSLQQKSNSVEGANAIFTLCSELMQRIVHLPIPTIAAVHAVATAAGCQLAASCDIVLASPSATFATPGVNIGLFCSTPAVALSRAVGMKKAAEMLFTGAPQTAEEMRIAGLVNHIIDGDIHAKAQEMAEVIAAKPTAVLQLGKRVFQQQATASLADAYRLAASTMSCNLVQEGDAIEGIDAFIAKRSPKFK